MDYVALEITVEPLHPWREVLISQLAAIGFESFTDEKKGLKAYIPEKDFNEKDFGAILSQARTMNAKVDYRYEVIRHQNWNAKWEANFDPVEIGDELIIKAPFHKVAARFKHEIVIEPQMSFGTGHHDTTFLLCKQMLRMNWQGLKVLDVGTGTGVLAILAQFLGAKEVMGTEIDRGSFENAVSNIAKNDVNTIQLLEVDITGVPKTEFDVILANINKNVLKHHIPFYQSRIKSGGTLLLSGFFDSDVNELNDSASENGFSFEAKFTQNNWAVVKYKKI